MEKPAQDIHEGYMRMALDMAKNALNEGEVPVGCVFVRKGQVIGRGWNKTVAKRNGTRHAELEAIEQMESNGFDPADFKDCDLYVTVEPCVIGIRKVYYGASNEKFGGCGSVLTVNSARRIGDQSHGYECVAAICKEEAIDLLKRFYATVRPSTLFPMLGLTIPQGNPNAPVPHRKGKAEG